MLINSLLHILQIDHSSAFKIDILKKVVEGESEIELPQFWRDTNKQRIKPLIGL